MMEYGTGDRAWIWLNSAVGVNVRVAEELVFMNDGLIPLFEAARGGRPLRLPDVEGLEERMRKRAQDRHIDGIIAGLDAKGIRAVTRESAEYPKLLREIFDPPTVLFVKGRLNGEMKLPIAVIGSRKCSDYGRRMAELFGRELAKNGSTVVSGMAAGCDGFAAWGALSVREAEHPTVAVLGTGVDVIYPSSNARLYDAIAERGAVISEYPPGSRASRESFPRRNRLISGMSKGLLVIEAGLKSGTSITAGCAHEQGRDVFAVPGRLTDISSEGTNRMIKDGEAKPVFGVDDILSEYGTFSLRAEKTERREDKEALTLIQKRIFDELSLGEKTADELCERLKMDASEINIYLTEMELSGIINKLAGGVYSV